MKNKLIRILCLLCAVLVLFVSMAVSVSAASVSVTLYDDYVIDDYLPGFVWDGIFQSVKTVSYAQQASQWAPNLIDPDYSTAPKKYYTGNTIPSDTVTVGNQTVGVTLNTVGNMVQAPIVNTTNNTFNYLTNNYNNTTNNYYETYNIKNTYYNQTYNTYKYEVTNNNNVTKNFYVNYSPTFVNVTYLDGAKSESQFYFYKLPDGRNTFDLHANEVSGSYFIYDYTNYNLVDDAGSVLQLNHFDGTHKDEINGQSFIYDAGASVNYVDHANFGSAVYWTSAQHDLSLNKHTYHGSSLEFMMFNAPPGTPSRSIDIPKSTYGYLYYQNKLPLSTDVNTAIATNKFLTGSATRFIYLKSQDAFKVSVAGSTTAFVASDYISNQVFSVYDIVGYVLRTSGRSAIPIYHYYELNVKQQYQKYTYFLDSSKDFLDCRVSLVSVSNSQYTLAYKDTSVSPGQNPYKHIPNGNWNSWAMASGQVYLNGLPVEMDQGSAGAANLMMFPDWGNYWLIDEYRSCSPFPHSTIPYVPYSMPFDVGKVLVLPTTGKQGQIAIKSNVKATSLRVGGVRPAVPVIGDTYVSLEKKDGKHIVQSIQQFQAGGWVAVDGAIYQDSKWVPLASFDMVSYSSSVPPPNPDIDPTPSSSSSGSASSSSSSTTSSSGSSGSSSSSSSSGGSSSSSSSGGGGNEGEPFNIWGALGGLFEAIFKFAAMLVSGIAQLLTSLVDAFTAFVNFGGQFGAFLAEAFVFIPSEIISVIVLGISLSILLMIINFFR